MTTLPFMGSLVTSVAGVEGCRITRCGYTGEDGVEISIPEKDTAKVTSALLESKAHREIWLRFFPHFQIQY